MSLLPILRQAEIFYDLSPTQLELIASIAQEKQYSANDLLFAENTRGDGLYVIANGEVQIQVNQSVVMSHQEEQFYTIATLRRGQSFGEIALVDEGLRSASARVTQHDTQLIWIPRDKLMLLCDSYPQLGYRMMRNLAADLAMKIRSTDMQVRDKLTWLHASPSQSPAETQSPQAS